MASSLIYCFFCFAENARCREHISVSQHLISHILLSKFMSLSFCPFWLLLIQFFPPLLYFAMFNLFSCSFAWTCFGRCLFAWLIHCRLQCMYIVQLMHPYNCYIRYAALAPVEFTGALDTATDSLTTLGTLAYLSHRRHQTFGQSSTVLEGMVQIKFILSERLSNSVMVLWGMTMRIFPNLDVPSAALSNNDWCIIGVFASSEAETA